ncbi:MFS transporter [Glycomyces sp. TRM65418]|uniref:MFS transporter n=1 Tax=Glycomyces sp. TRM65418 TaxID=2867006 RepID=UPI001CE5A481|nr:MFS transporter [Glycomyces sp. TRM65418]MCC3763549.1 MFS transporter [Glycomyces sp. TRM65418]QZD57532.1 MFS transporter [Glycomyces sp. TRM65418]
MTATQTRPTAASERSLWHNGDFLKFWFGESVSLLGTQVTNLALPLTAILAFNAGDEQVGVLRFLQLVPYLGLALVFGVWADRVRRRPIMLGANLARAVLLALVPLLYWTDALSMAFLLVIACAVGIASVLFDVSWMAYVPALVRDPKHYVEAGAKMGMSSSAADVAGPGLAGLLISAVSAPVALIVDACSYLLSLVSLLLIRAPEPRPAPPPRRHLPTELREGLRWVIGSPVLRSLALIGCCCNFSMVTVWTMFLLYGTRDLHLDSATLGGILATASVGGLIGAAISRSVIRRFRLGLVYLVAQSALLVGPALIVVAGGPRPVMVGMFILSFFTTYLGLGVAGVVIVSLRQASTPQSMMGRMTAVFRTLLFGGGALGGLAAGLLAGRIGAHSALTVAAIGSAAVLVALVLSPVIRLRDLPATPGATEADGTEPEAPGDGATQVTPDGPAQDR